MWGMSGVVLSYLMKQWIIKMINERTCVLYTLTNIIPLHFMISILLHVVSPSVLNHTCLSWVTKNRGNARYRKKVMWKREKKNSTIYHRWKETRKRWHPWRNVIRESKGVREISRRYRWNCWHAGRLLSTRGSAESFQAFGDLSGQSVSYSITLYCNIASSFAQWAQATSKILTVKWNFKIWEILFELTLILYGITKVTNLLEYECIGVLEVFMHQFKI